MTVSVAVLGAAGPVGRRLAELVARHDRFELRAVTTDDPADAGEEYESVVDDGVPHGGPTPEESGTRRDPTDGVPGRRSEPLPPWVADVPVVEPTAAGVPDVDLLCSALPSELAETLEPTLADRGHVICSTATNALLAGDVPLVVPEVNPEHLALVARQRAERGWNGALVKTPGAATVATALPLAALDEFAPQSVHVTTIQSGTDADGVVAAPTTLDNVVPTVDGQPSRLVTALGKVTGDLHGDTRSDGPLPRVDHTSLDVTASCHRAPVSAACLASLRLQTGEHPTPVTVEETLRTAAAASLPSAPTPPVRVRVRRDRPQPRLDRDAAGGQAVVVGPVERVDGALQFDALANEVVRGAAGGVLLNAELALASEFVPLDDAGGR